MRHFMLLVLAFAALSAVVVIVNPDREDSCGAVTWT